MPGQHATNKRIVSLRVDKDIVARFNQYARSCGMTPTALLARYITKQAYKAPKKSQDV